eukprot:TRINITY_DN5326_c0_g1_i1.p2 TRINITY_DN5326_c0_g1~~TRINITY_DN5326_c0_g1_i1.p2  ORF type:complete len:122 (-),score=45.87 TRINITY_DN5326_c0_g1_i1:239-604(-)
MKLLMHNLLSSPVKGADPSFPLEIVCTRLETGEEEYDETFARSSLQRIEYPALAAASNQLGHALPDALPEDAESNEEFLRALHHALVNLDVIEGELKCPGSGRAFPIIEGIPNLLLREDEI